MNLIIFKHYQPVISKAAFTLTLLVAGSFAVAQQDADTSDRQLTDSPVVPELPVNTAQSVEPNAEPAVTMEQITVTGQRSFFTLRAQIEDAEKALYSTYNDLNLDDQFDVNCKQSNRTGSYISEQVCWPAFFENAVAENSQDFFLGIAVLEPVAQFKNQYQRQFSALRANILKVAIDNPEVEDALVELGKLEAAYKNKRDECMKQAPVLFIFRICR